MTDDSVDDADIAATVSRVDQQFRDQWEQAGVRPTPDADSLVVARRLALAMAGTVPSLEDIRRLQSHPAARRLGWWTDHLLNDRRAADYLGERLARGFVGVEEGPFLVFRRRRFVAWLSDQLHENVPYDRLVRDLISNDGLWTDSPAVNFITVTADATMANKPDPVRLASRTTRAFLGVRLDCVECHDDNLDGIWRQQDFHQLAAFFAEVESTAVGIRDRSQEYRFTYLNESEEEVVPIAVPFSGQCLTEGGSSTAREQLAQWVTHPENGVFARAAVNRIWALAFGRPLVEPIDRIPVEGPFPPALETLASDFRDHQFDLRRLWRIIAATEVFRRSSRASFEITELHERTWAAFPLTRLRPEQVAGALLQSARLTTIDASSHILVRLARAEQLNEFVTRYGDIGEDEFADRTGTIPQRLLMMNGTLVKERTRDDLISNAATRIAVLSTDSARAIESVYLTVLSRYPTESERDYFGDQLSELARTSWPRFFEDLCWVLLNSSEFAWNH